MAAFAHSVLFMMLAWTSVIALHSTSPKRTRAESVAEDKIHTMETEPSTHSGVDDAQWRQLHNLVDAKLTQMSNTMETQMTELRKEVKNEVAELSNDVAKLERGAILSHDVEANHKFCKIGHTDDYIHTYKTDRGYYSFKWIQKGLVNIQFAWEENKDYMFVYCSDYNDTGKWSGSLKENRETFFDVLPFPNLFNKLKKAFDPEMTRQKCTDLIMDIEFDRPGGIPPSEGWVNSFVRDNMDKFLRLVEDRGGDVEKK